MNEKAALLTLRWNMAIILCYLLVIFYSGYLAWQWNKDLNQPDYNYYPQKLLLRIDDLVKQGRPPGIGTTPVALITHDFVPGKISLPLTAEQRAHLELFLETTKAAHPEQVSIWDIKDSALDYPSRRETGYSITIFIFTLINSLGPALFCLLSFAIKASKDSFRLWAYGDRFVLEPISQRSACTIVLLYGCMYCTIGYASVMFADNDEPLVTLLTAILNPFIVLELFSIYKNALFTRVKDRTGLPSSTWWLVY